MKDIGDLTAAEIKAAKFVSTRDTKVLYMRFPFKVMGTLGTIHTERDPYLLDIGRLDPLIPRAERAAVVASLVAGGPYTSDSTGRFEQRGQTSIWTNHRRFFILRATLSETALRALRARIIEILNGL